jgi:hypothetical protein
MRTRYIWRKAGSVWKVVNANDALDVINGGLFHDYLGYYKLQNEESADHGFRSYRHVCNFKLRNFSVSFYITSCVLAKCRVVKLTQCL